LEKKEIEMKTENNDLTFEAFKNSFNYGARSDLNFKFLKNLSTADAARFVQGLFKIVMESIEDCENDFLEEYVFSAQTKAYSGDRKQKYENSPFKLLEKPLRESSLALLTSSGHFVEGDDPQPFGVKKMSQEEAEERIMDFIRSEPVLSRIPVATPNNRLRVRHGGYDVSGAQKDPNVNFPLSLLREIRSERKIGSLSHLAYSFVGATSQTRLQKHAIPEWIEEFKEQKIDAMLLVPV